MSSSAAKGYPYCCGGALPAGPGHVLFRDAAVGGWPWTCWPPRPTLCGGRELEVRALGLCCWSTEGDPRLLWCRLLLEVGRFWAAWKMLPDCPRLVLFLWYCYFWVMKFFPCIFILLVEPWVFRMLWLSWAATKFWFRLKAPGGSARL